MQKRRETWLKLIFLVVAGCLTTVSGAMADDSASRSSCIACHTDENMLVKHLSTEKPKKSALTAGAG